MVISRSRLPKHILVFTNVLLIVFSVDQSCAVVQRHFHHPKYGWGFSLDTEHGSSRDMIRWNAYSLVVKWGLNLVNHVDASDDDSFGHEEIPRPVRQPHTILLPLLVCVTRNSALRK